MPIRPSLMSALAGDDEVEALLSDESQLQAILDFEIALAQSQADAGLIPAAAAAAIAAALSRFSPDWQGLFAGLSRDGVVVPALLQQLRAAIGPTHAGSLHHGATSQDAIDTALMLQLARIIPKMLARLASVEASFASLSASYGHQPLMAHTRMQAARPFTVADKLRTWSEPLGRLRTALSDVRSQVLVVQLGGPVGDRSGFSGKGDEVASGVAKRLDLGVAESWQSSRDSIIALGSLLSLITGALGKFGADVALLAQTELAAISLRSGGSSSSMPHKTNPVDAEVLVALARYNAGLVGTLHQAMVHENERSGSAWTLEWLTLPQMLVTTGASLRLATRLAGAISF